MGIFNRRSTSHVPRRTVPLIREAGPATDRVSLEKAAGVSLLKRFDKAGLALSQRGLVGVRAQAVMLLDHSASMSHDYQDGTVQALVERALGFALQVDADGKVPIIRFDSRVHPEIVVDVTNYQAIVAQGLYEPRKMGSTDLAGGLREIRKIAAQTDLPMFVIVVTDGEPNDPAAATAEVTALAELPVFLKFLAIRPVSYLKQLDDMDGRLVDNANAQAIDPRTMSDLDFADAMVDEFDEWLTAAQGVGLLS